MRHRYGHILAPQVARPGLNWKRLSDVREQFGRTARTLTRWCIDGTFIDFGYEVYLHRGEWFIANKDTSAISEIKDTSD